MPQSGRSRHDHARASSSGDHIVHQGVAATRARVECSASAARPLGLTNPLRSMAGLQDCRIAGLQDCRVAGLQGCRVAGLQGVFQGWRLHGMQESWCLWARQLESRRG